MMKVHTWQMASRLGTCPMNFGGAKRDISQRLKGVFRCQGFGMQSLYPKSVYILTRREGLEFRRLSRFIPVLEGKATTSLFVVDESLACTRVGQQLDKDHRAGGMTTVILAYFHDMSRHDTASHICILQVFFQKPKVSRSPWAWSHQADFASFLIWSWEQTQAQLGCTKDMRV